MAEKYCDILIVGLDLAGLITGAFLAKRGLSVMVIHSDKDIITSKKNIQPNLVTHLDSKLFKSIMGRLSIMDHDLGIIRKLSVPFQVVLPKHRIDVFTDRELFERELRREFPHDFKTIKDFYSNMDLFESVLDTETLQELILPKTFREKWKFKRFVQNSGLSERLSYYLDDLKANSDIKTFLEAQLRFLASTYSDNPFTYVISKLLSNENCLLYEVKGGMGRLKKVFLDKIESYSGIIKEDSSIESFTFEKRKLSNVKLSGFDGSIACRYLIWNQQIKDIEKLVPKNIWTSPLLKRIKNINPKQYHFSIRFELNKSQLPEGMKENVLYVADAKQALTGSNFFHVNIYQPEEVYDLDKVYLNVSYLLAAESIQTTREYLRVIHEEIQEHLKHLMPFANSLKLIFPVDHAQLPLQSDDGHLLFQLEKDDYQIFRENAQDNPIYELFPNSFAELFPLSNRTFYKNLFLTSPEVLAALGFEGKFLLGLKTIDLIWREVEGSRKKAIKQRKIA